MELTTILTIIIFLIGLAIAFYLGNKAGQLIKNRQWEKRLPQYRKQAVQKSREVLGGQFSEQLAPFLPNFKHSPTECKFLGKPVDLLVFKGLDKKEVDEIVFIEVKSGNSQLTPIEKKLKTAIKKKKVKWEEYRIPKEITKRRE